VEKKQLKSFMLNEKEIPLGVKAPQIPKLEVNEALIDHHAYFQKLCEEAEIEFGDRVEDDDLVPTTPKSGDSEVFEKPNSPKAEKIGEIENIRFEEPSLVTEFLRPGTRTVVKDIFQELEIECQSDKMLSMKSEIVQLEQKAKPFDEIEGLLPQVKLFQDVDLFDANFRFFRSDPPISKPFLDWLPPIEYKTLASLAQLTPFTDLSALNLELSWNPIPQAVLLGSVDGSFFEKLPLFVKNLPIEEHFDALLKPKERTWPFTGKSGFTFFKESLPEPVSNKRKITGRRAQEFQKAKNGTNS
jgi:hypothetical protein